MVKKLDVELGQFARRRLNEPFPYVVLDARYEKVRIDSAIQSQAVLIAVGIGRDGGLAALSSCRRRYSRWRNSREGLW